MCGLNFHCFVKAISSASYDMVAGIIENVAIDVCGRGFEFVRKTANFVWLAWIERRCLNRDAYG